MTKFQVAHRLKGSRIWQSLSAFFLNNLQAPSKQSLGSYLIPKKNLYTRLLNSSQECLGFPNTCLL
jgi:hypothetical protein